jgi:hypothetical protein
MAERANELGDTDLEQALVDLGKELPYPLTPDLAAAVRECIEAGPRLSQRLRRVT